MSDATIKIVSHEEGKVIDCSLLKLAENVGWKRVRVLLSFLRKGFILCDGVMLQASLWSSWRWRNGAWEIRLLKLFPVS